MQSIHEMYEELYKAIREMPLPSSPDDPESPEPEEYVEPGWVAQLDSMDQIEWLAPEFGARKREWYKAFNAELLFIRKCGGSLEVPEELRDWEF